MDSYLISQQFLRVAALVFVVLAAAVAVILSGRDKDPAVLAPSGRDEADALVSQLARCRTITPDDTAGLDACRRIWAQTRQRFFSAKSPQLPNPAAPNAPALLTKSHDQVPPSEVDKGRTR